ncbi:atrial natriuretic peptide receptor 2-like [Paramacrobiotus metropolitanus]|uniref:atrial natriuretic peptide receptor 2-like n=1 Tax=Paramacrobiotus metropolitanus TaxID=2943436 RepID=UPI0024457785|nr:atrial natriuretic peptide receptor 2-like [Paramacrobiotus metropolitanus]
MIAEFYKSVTVSFSDLDNFVDWMSSVPPVAVIGTVTALFSAFDGAIQEFDVYKVETVRDSYMAVSGIPVRCDNQHAVEICRMAFTLLRVFAGSEAAVMSTGAPTDGRTVVAHPQVRPHSLLGLRCGIHSGPCAAGVIGMRVPRYCL